MNVQDIVNVSIGLSATPASQAKFTVPLLLVDHADIPIDQRYRIVTHSSYATDLTAATAQVAWCAALWEQNYNPAQAYIGRWVLADSNPYVVCVGFETTIATWAAVSDGSLTVTTTAGADVMTAIDFTGDTTLAEVAASIQVKLTAGGLSGALCEVDALDRIIFRDPAVTGAGSDTVVLSGGGAGTDIYGTSWLNGASSYQQGGVDIEGLGTAASAIFALDNTPFIVCEDAGSTAQQVAGSTAINALDKILLLVNNDANAINSGDTTDAGYQIEALSHQKTHLTYTEHLTQYPDAAIIGEVCQVEEGSRSFALVPFSGVSESGLNVDGTTVEPITATQRTTLEAKGYDYLIAPSTVTHLRHGLAAGGNEMRIMIFKSYMAAKCGEEIYGYMIANDVVTFSDSDIQAIKGIISKYVDIGVDRKVFEEGSAVWNMPAAADFTAATKATHTMTLSNVLSVTAQSSVNDMTITFSFTI